jgi:hypothetical protein
MPNKTHTNITHFEIIPKEYVICPICSKIGRLLSYKYSRANHFNDPINFLISHSSHCHFVSPSVAETLEIVALDYKSNVVEKKYSCTTKSKNFTIPKNDYILIIKSNRLKNENRALLEKILKEENYNVI